MSYEVHKTLGKNKTNPYYDLSFSADGDLLGTSQKNGVISVVDIINDYKTKCSFMGHQVYKARKIRIDRKADKSTRLIYSTEGGPENGSQTEKMLGHCLRMVDIENISKILLTFVGHRDKVTSIALHPELPIFASAGKDGQYFIWDTRSPHPAYHEDTAYFKNQLCWSKCGRTLCISRQTSSKQTKIATFNFQNMKIPIVEEEVFDTSVPKYKDRNTLKNYFVTDIQYSEDNKSIMATTNTNLIMKYSSSLTKPQRLAGHYRTKDDRCPLSAAFLQDEIICGGNDKTIYFWKRNSGALIKSKALKTINSVQRIHINPSYDNFVTLDNRGIIQSWVPS